MTHLTLLPNMWKNNSLNNTQWHKNAISIIKTFLQQTSMCVGRTCLCMPID
uniref:Uncharacterized protein n=1 Tax=Aegilops tauschii subsp. strangulata TaxID=200361 RepID=A0A453B0E7_AEGTS